MSFKKVLLIIPISFWFCLLSIWAIPHVKDILIENGTQEIIVTIMMLVSCLGILLFGVVCWLWALEFFNKQEGLRE